MEVINYLSLEKDVPNTITRGRTGIKKLLMFNHLPAAGFTYAFLEPKEAQKQHFHKTGMDIFIIQAGSGVVHTGDIHKTSLDLSNRQTTELKKGDVYFIDIYQMHAIENTGSERLVWLNIAPLSHGDEDLYIL